MDQHQFDRWSRALATGEIRSRRHLLKALGGGALAAIVGRSAADDTMAARDRCRHKPDLCTSMSKRSTCGGTGTICACITTVSGSKACADIRNPACPTRDECNNDDDCRGKDNLCFVAQGCCGSPKNICLHRCGAVAVAPPAASGGGLPLLRRR